MKIQCFLVTVIAIGLSAPAKAEWEFARWGMSVDEVVAASNGVAAKVKKDKDKRVWDFDRLAAGSWEEGGIAYELSFYFDSKAKTLKLVDLVPGSIDCDRVIAAYGAKYGTAETARKAVAVEDGRPPLVTETHKWNHLESGDLLQITDVSVKDFGIRYCKVLIQPADGLV